MKVFFKITFMIKYCFLFFLTPLILFSQINFSNQNSFDVVTWNLEWFPKQGPVTVDSLKNIIEIINAEVYALQEINNVNEFNQLLNSLDNYDGYSTNSSNLNLAFIYKNDLIVDSIYTILSSENYFFAGRPPLVLELNFNNEKYYIINNHFKCCGDGILDLNDSGDEEYRRYNALLLIKEYVDLNLTNSNVIILGDLNDLIEESFSNNIFTPIINDSLNYLISDKYIPLQNSSNWSFPNWPSHLDHIVITHQLFDNLIDINQDVRTIRVDNYFGSFQLYDNLISDHLPVGINLFYSFSNINIAPLKSINTIKNYNILGQSSRNSNNILFQINNEGRLEKKIIFE